MVEPLEQNTPNRLFVTRREILSLSWVGMLGIGLAKFAQALVQAYIPRRPQGKYGGEFEVGTLAEMPEINDPPMNFPEGRFSIIRTEDGLLALHRVCTHLDCLVSWNDSEAQFVCPCHGSTFARSGECLQGPAQRSLDRFHLQIVSPEGEVIAESNDSDGDLPVDQLLSSEENSAVFSEFLVLVNTGEKIQVSANNSETPSFLDTKQKS